LFAAVGHDGWVSYVNLQSGTVAKMFQVITDVHALVLAGNGYIYLFPARDWSDIYSLRISDGMVTATSAIYDGRLPRLYADGHYLYVGGSYWFSEWNISGGTAVLGVSGGLSSTCGNLWLTEEGDRMFTSCAKVYRTAPLTATDLQYNGALSNTSGLVWADHSTLKKSTVVIPSPNAYPPGLDTQLQIYGDAFLGYAGTIPLPQFQVNSSLYDGHGKFVFWTADQTRQVVVMKADSTANLLSSYGLSVISPSVPTGSCSVSISKSLSTIPFSGGFDAIGVATGSACVWTATSSAPWLTVAAGSYGFGPASVSISAAANQTGVSRTATLLIADKTVLVTQPAVACSYNLTPLNDARSGSPSFGSVSVTSPSGCGWTASVDSGAPWISITAATGSGNGIVNYSVTANTTGGSRSGVMTIAGQSFNVSQAPQNSNPGVFRSGFYWLQDVDGNQQFNTPPDAAFAFGGVPGDIPITGDWNGNGHTKVGVYRPANGLFILDYDGDGQFTAADKVYNLGVGVQAGDVPVVGDWNGNGKTKVGLFRQGFFWILDTNGNGVFEQGVDNTYAFGGVAGDVPVVGDWNGTGTSKIGLFRLGFYWILDANGNGSLDNINGAGGDQAFAYGGIAGDMPVVGDWNGSGASKVGVFRQGFFWVLDANGNHTFDGTGPGQDLAFPFGGISGDVPVMGKW
jgi:hypothetical protein